MDNVKMILGDKELDLRPSFKAIKNIEKDLGVGIPKYFAEWAGKASDGELPDITITDAAFIVYHGCVAAGDTRHTVDQIGDMIVEEGMAKISVSLLDFICRAATGKGLGDLGKEGKPQEASQ